MLEAASIGDPENRNTFAGYSKHFWSASVPKDRWNELTWANRRHNPIDERSRTPVQRHKFLTQPDPNLSHHSHWVAPTCPPLSSYSRSKEERNIHTSTAKSRCEEWSTLRQMLPSRGHDWPIRPPKWGINRSMPPVLSARHPRRYPHINSAMTNYIDDMHKANQFFRLF